MKIHELAEELHKNPPSLFPDDNPNEIHGQDSCLEMVCDKCGYEESSNRIKECCGQAMRIW